MEQITALNDQKILAACLQKAARWYQSVTEPSSYLYRGDLTPVFEKVLIEIFLNEKQDIQKILMHRSSSLENSSDEFKLFFEQLSRSEKDPVPLEWFPISHLHIKLKSPILVDACIGEQNNHPSPVYTLEDFKKNL